jgi:hypothetical protein
MRAQFSAVLAAAALVVAMAGVARADGTRLIGSRPAPTADELTIDASSPVYGTVTLPVSAFDPLVETSTALGQDFAARYSASIYGGELGVFARVADRPRWLSPDTATAFNLGALVGYGGFYLQGALTGLDDNSVIRTAQSWQSWQAGLGYGAGAFDVRLTYAFGQGTPAFAGRSFDNTQWMLGGIYQFTPRIRFNADAFTGRRFAAPGFASAAPGSAPQGTGARVGVQLRF